MHGSCLRSLMKYGSRSSSSWPPLLQHCSVLFLIDELLEQFSLTPRNSSPVKTKTKRTGTRGGAQIVPVLSARLGFCAVQIGTLSHTFRDNLSVPSSKTKLSIAWAVKMGPTGRPEMSLTTCRSALRNNPEERRSHWHCGGNLKSRTLQYYQLPDKKKTRHFEGYLEFFAAFRGFYSFIPRFPAEPLTKSFGTLFGKVL